MEIRAALHALGAVEKEFSLGDTVLSAGSLNERFGLVLDGSVLIESNDLWGNRTLLSHAGRGQIFGESGATRSREPLLWDVIAGEDCRILFFRTERLLSSRMPVPSWQIKILTSLLSSAVRKNYLLTSRSFHTSPKSCRGRILAYLNSFALQKGTLEFDIPYDRQQLADYLNLDRSALSRELSRLQQEGLLTCRKSHFVLHKRE